MSKRVLVIDSREHMTLCVDRKQGLQEVAGNLVQQHDRFRAECLRAQENGIRLVVLIEDERIKALAEVATWQNPRMKRWGMIRAQHENGKALSVPLGAPPVNGERLMKSMATMAERYGVEWRFTEKSRCGAEIVKILTEENGK